MSNNVIIDQDRNDLSIEENIRHELKDLGVVPTGWNTKMKEAPQNVQILVQDKNMRDTLATFDPTWGGGRGGWFNRKNQMVTGVWCWRSDVESYLADRAKIRNAVPVH